MKKFSLKLLSLVSSVIMVLSMVSISVFAEDNILSYLKYAINDGEATIISCDKSIRGDVVIPDKIEGYPVTSICNYAFYGCKNLTSISIPDDVTSISKYTFGHCISLTSITIPDSVISIGCNAFDNCTSLTNITIPDNVTSIGDAAFLDCNGLVNITIPDSVTYIGSETFKNTAYYNNESNWKDNVLYINNHLIEAKDTITSSYEIKPGTITIGCYAFWDCKSLESITIPDSVTSIGDAAFAYCESLESITIPNSVTSIGSLAFYSTKYYNNESNWENNVLYINNHLIEAKDTITGNYEIKPGTITIGDSSFYGCTELTGITFPVSTTSIGRLTFNYCNGLTSITIPASVTNIDEAAFFNCNNLISITIPDSVISINFYAFGYYYDSETDSYKTIKSLTIYGCIDSAAEIYANKNGINFIATEESIYKLVIKDNNNITITDTVVNSSPEMSVKTFIASVENANVQILDKDNKELAKGAFIGTGSKINILDKDGNVLSTYEVMVKSDIDGNGKITPADARLALRASANLDKVEGVFETAANYDDKDKVSTADARMILRKSAGLEK